jgi:RNA 3'-terminal phosphate cyclase (ATP)
MITIDGSIGEGGGQILRTALALSLTTGQPFQLNRIRAGRKKPGLLRQHLTAVEAAAAIGSADVTGAAVGSSELTFIPGEIKPGEYQFAIGTAGSTTLVMQTILPALITAHSPSSLILEGGTHNPFAPPFDFLEKCFLPVLNRMGPTVTVKLERHGFFPAGGGRFTVNIEPVSQLKPFNLMERGEICSRRARILLSALPESIAQRELKVLKEKCNWPEESFCFEQISGAVGPGNIILIEIASEQITEVFTGFGERGMLAENVAANAIVAMRRYLTSGVPVGEYLADQLLIPMALARTANCQFRTMPLTRHSLTNIQIIEQFLQGKFHLKLLTDCTHVTFENEL